MSRLVLTKEQLCKLKTELLQDDKENCGVVFGRSVEVSGELVRIVAKEYFKSPDEAYSIRSSERAQLRPEFVSEVAQESSNFWRVSYFYSYTSFPSKFLFSN